MEYGKQLLCWCDDDKSFFGKVGAPSIIICLQLFHRVDLDFWQLLLWLLTVFKIMWTLEQTICFITVACNFLLGVLKCEM